MSGQYIFVAVAVKVEAFSSLAGPCPKAFHIKVGGIVVAVEKLGLGGGGGGAGGAFVLYVFVNSVEV